MTDKCYSVVNTPLEPTMVYSTNVLDQVWVPQSHLARVSQVSVLKDSKFGSDHYPIMIIYNTSQSWFIMRKIKWNLLQTDPDKRGQLQSRLSQKLSPLFHSMSNMDENAIWEEFVHICTQSSAKVLGTIDLHNNLCNSNDIYILRLNKQRTAKRRQLRRAGIRNTHKERIKASIKRIDQKIKKFNKKEKQNSFTNYLNKATESHTKAYIEMCKLRNHLMLIEPQYSVI
eukprot:NODE_711_length_4530_cov_1.118935.p3 type:complete len:228 gc:universal NODE_711_length_4530_cov_1.118935:1894-2577(+)